MDEKLKQKIRAILKKYESLFAEPLKSVNKYLEDLMEDKKPGTTIEIYSMPLQEVQNLKLELEEYFFVFGGETSNKETLSISKVKSIAKELNHIQNAPEGVGASAGVYGLLVGYPLKDDSHHTGVLSYIQESHLAGYPEDKVKSVDITEEQIQRAKQKKARIEEPEEARAAREALENKEKG